MKPTDGAGEPASGTADHAIDGIIGRRAEQQDRGWVGPVQLADGEAGLMLLVADGMGGAVGGALASSLAVEAFRSRFDAAGGAPLRARLREALDAANQAIAEAIAADRSKRGMGTTLVAAVVQGASVTWISVGDSLLLASRNGSIRRLNEDHSLASVLDEAASRGEISQDEADGSPQRNVLRSALTGGKIAMVHVEAANLAPGTRLVAATDGILTLSFARVGSLEQVAPDARSLVHAILEAISEEMPADQDNVTTAIASLAGRPAASERQQAAVPTWSKALIAGGMIACLSALIAIGYLVYHDSPPIAGDQHVEGPRTGDVTGAAPVRREERPAVNSGAIPQGLEAAPLTPANGGIDPNRLGDERHRMRLPALTHPTPTPPPATAKPQADARHAQRALAKKAPDNPPASRRKPSGDAPPPPRSASIEPTTSGPR